MGRGDDEKDSPLTARRAPPLRRLLSAVNIQPGEGRRVAWMMLYSAAAVGGFLTVGLAAASALFLGELPASATPFVFISSGASSVIVFLLYSLAMSRLPHNALVLVSDAILLAFALALRLLLSTPQGQRFPVLLALFLFIDAGSTLVITQFWVRAAQIFYPREAKRLFGLIAAAGTASSMVASLGLRFLVAAIGVANLLLVVAVALVLCMLCARVLGQIQGVVRLPAPTAPPVHRPPQPARSSFLADLGALFRTPLLLLIAGLTILTALLINTGAYQYFLALQALYAGRSQEMVGFLGTFGVVTGLIALFVQLYLSSRLLRRLGVFAALAFFPLAMAAGAGLGLTTGGALLAMALVRGADPVFRQTLHQSAMAVLYLPVPQELAQRVKAVLEIAYASSFGLLGVAFLFSRRWPGWSHTTWSLPVLGFSVLWFLLLLWGRRPYQYALAESLRKRRLDFARATIDIGDETTIQVLAAALRSADDLLVVHTLELLSHASRVDWTPQIAPLLGHPSQTVRALALKHLGQPGTGKSHAERVAAMLQAPEADVRAAAVSAISGIGGPLVADLLAPCLGDPSPEVRGPALVALGRVAGSTWRKTATDALRVSLRSDDPCERVSAMRAAGALRSRELLPILIASLGQRPFAAEAADAIVLFGPGLEHELEKALDDPSLAPTARARIPSVLGRLGSREASDILSRRMLEPDPEIRSAVLAGLAHLAPLFPPAGAELHRALSAEIRGYYDHYVLSVDLQTTSGGSLLAEALAIRLRQALDRILLLLGMLYPMAGISGLQKALDGGPSSERSTAVELLDNLVPGETRALLVPALEGTPDQVLAVAGRQLGITRETAETRLGELDKGNDPWLRMCAAERRGGTMALPVIERVLFLRAADLFSQLSAEDLVPVAERAEEVHLRAGETFIRQGEPGDCMYLIVDGEASIAVSGLGRIDTRGPKGAIGEMAIIWRRPRSADCTALTDITALRIDYETFWELMDERPALAQGVIKVLALRLDAAMENLQNSRTR